MLCSGRIFLTQFFLEKWAVVDSGKSNDGIPEREKERRECGYSQSLGREPGLSAVQP